MKIGKIIKGARKGYDINRCSTKVLCSVPPEEMQIVKRLCIAHMRIFGNIVYVMVSDEKRGKLNAKRMKCVFFRYCKSMKAYRLMCLGTKKIVKSRDIVFMEDNRTFA